MKTETLIYDRIKAILPDSSEKTVFFTMVSRTGYEIIFYTFFDGVPKQCFTLAQEGFFEENELDEVFADVAELLRGAKEYRPEFLNLATLTIWRGRLSMEFQYYERNEKLYAIKKKWKQEYIDTKE